MRTTLRIDDALLADTYAYAARSGKILAEVVDDALRMLLSRLELARADRVELLVYRGGGFQPGVDLDNSAMLLELMEEDDPPV